MEFITIRIIDLIDILLVAALMYYAYQFLRGTFAINIVSGIILIYLVWKLTDVLSMTLLSEILGNFIGVGVIAFIVVFKEEIRNFLVFIGSSSFNRQNLRLNFFQQRNAPKTKINASEIVEAFYNMSNSRTGALLVFERLNSLYELRRTGLNMSIRVNQPILESIFFKNAPLHDGAVVVSKNIIVATNVILPVSKDTTLPIRYGLRHKAAIETSRITDATVLVCSEETGRITYFKGGQRAHYESKEALVEMIEKDLS